jgi:hypothetical protein
MEESSWKFFGQSLKLYSLFNDVDIIKRMKINGLIWAGHVVRRENEEIIKRIMLVKPEGRRKKGRPRMRWMDGWCEREKKCKEVERE